MLKSRLSFLLRERSGQVTVTLGVALPVMMMGLAGSVDYARWLSVKSDIQNAADTAALAGAKELRLAQANPITVAGVARRRALAALGTLASRATVQATVPNLTTVHVEIDATSPSLFNGLAPVALSHIHAQATAQTASTPTCLIALDPKGKGLTLKTAAVTANGCAAYADALDQKAISLDTATIQAAQTCSAGGVSMKKSVALPAPITDCPVLADPLAARAPPPVGACLTLGNMAGKPYVVSGGTQTLFPGTYCGGLAITAGASVTLNPGIYVMSGGPLTVDQNASVQGDGIGIYFTGDKAVLDLDLQSSVSLVAPIDGPMAGILMFEDRQAKSGQDHILGSQNAPKLLGTIYLPQGSLTIGAPLAKPLQSQLLLDITTCSKLNQPYPCSPTTVLAQQSAWTIVIANDITVNFIVNLQLNTNYSASTTAPPAEIAFRGASLTQ